jgi:outer membrane protein OmpA-like peptidoglycan-associated protein/outer membrane murein-binding lipoprotein Lpp
MQPLRSSPTMMRLLISGIATSVALLAGCASQPVRNEQLEHARTTVQSLEQDPNAQQAAADQLRDSRRDLQRADAAFQKGESPQQVTYLAYLADHEAQAGKAFTDEYRTRQALAKGNEERNRILLEARNQEIQQARQTAQTAQQRMQDAQAQAQSAQNQLQQERQQLAEMKTRQTARGLELTLASNLLFNTGSSTLKPGATLQLGRLADFMRGNSKARIIIEGYTDNRGSADYNQQLSQARAQAVASALESEGIGSDRIQPIGRGKDFPVASNETPAGRQQNRRVDIVLSDMSGRFAQAATQAPPPQ